MNGIDIASHQAGIDLPRVFRESPTDFVVVKVCQGSYENPFWRQWADQTLAAGKLLGLYDYAPGGDPTAEAKRFCDLVEPYVGRAILVLDWESDQNSQFGTHAAWTHPWRDYVLGRFGVEPVLYSNFWCMPLNPAYRYTWVAQYDNYEVSYYQERPWNEGAYDCTIRQYKGSGGRVAGYGGDVDLNKAYIDAGEWISIAGGEPATDEEEDSMVCLFQPNDEGFMIYYDGTALHALDHEDEAEAIRMVYRQCNGGKEIPQFKLGSKEAPWASRFVDAVNHGMHEGIVSSFH